MSFGRKILCVDDNVDFCDILKRLLESSGQSYSVTGAHNTEEALKLIAAERFDLYVLDTWMPDIGGLQLCKRIREKDPSTPIVFLTSLGSAPNRKKALAAGGNAFLNKLEDLEKLVPTIKRLLENSDAVAV
jgi:CheY-like chemotaxis protein